MPDERVPALAHGESVRFGLDSDRPIRVLVAEDHQDTRDALRLLLEMEGYEVFTAKDGQEALNLALDRRPDVVITDFDMPRLDGAGLSQALRSVSHRLGKVPIVVLTALSWSLVQRAMEAGADMHIAKPVDFHMLTQTLSKVAERVREQSFDGSPAVESEIA